MSVIPEILKVVGVRKWEDLKGKYVRVETNGLGRTVTKMGNLIDDVWLDLDDFLILDSTIHQNKQLYGSYLLLF